ncbi:hypothetical protein EI427_02950 [Flammeovirga pectinis]|uniref:STAS/SEC14 domain-containing protein n=1 Tax=Flammeovirga pectinis TaxID=2494373 RepID=A0A3Q9FNI6_9BACT|nr:STAS/SEC14 domain-containing protein [Flammeovirga pectinis]AZQ61214.1 hypothetical protein EI427_02950 [Flammeovirga pectinis]
MSYLIKYKSDFQVIEWNESTKIVKSSWNTPINLSEKLYREELNQYFKMIEELTPSLILVDAIKAYYNIHPDTQEWINQRNIEIHKKIHLRRMAWVVSSDLFSQVSFEQALDDVKSNNIFKLQYFDNVEEAENWLSKNLD